MTPEVQQALDRVMNGRSGPGDDRILRDALLRMAPSSREYKMIAAAVGQGTVIGGTPTPAANPFPGIAPASNATRGEYGFDQDQQHPGALTPTRDFMQGWGTPTLDFLQGAGTPGYMTPTGDFMQGPGSLIQGTAATPENAAIGQRMTGKVPGESGFADPFAALEAAGQRPSVAEQVAESQRNTAGQSNVAGNAPPTTPTELKGWDQLWEVAGMEPKAAGQDLQTDVQGEDFPDPGITIDPGGNMSFSGSTPQGIELLYSDPATYLQRYSKAKGMPNAAGSLSMPYDAARALSQYGVLGDQYGESNLFSGDPKGYQEQLTDIESFLNDYNQPGAAVNPQYYVEQIIDRAVTTDWENVINPDTRNPYTPNQIIDETNKAVMAVGNLMPTDGQEWLASVLLQASQEYREGVADGSINLLEMSYAQFLRDQKGLVENMR
jgi:hypothetical protein